MADSWICVLTFYSTSFVRFARSSFPLLSVRCLPFLLPSTIPTHLKRVQNGYNMTTTQRGKKKSGMCYPPSSSSSTPASHPRETLSSAKFNHMESDDDNTAKNLGCTTRRQWCRCCPNLDIRRCADLDRSVRCTVQAVRRLYMIWMDEWMDGLKEWMDGWMDGLKEWMDR